MPIVADAYDLLVGVDTHAANHAALTAAVTAQAPELLQVRGVGPVMAATVLQTWSHPGRLHSEAAFAALAGVSPLPASSGNTQRHHLNRGGDRQLNQALYTIALTRLGHDPRTRAHLARRTAAPPHRRRPHPTRDHPHPQALHQPRTLPTAHRHPATTKHHLTVIEASHWYWP